MCSIVLLTLIVAACLCGASCSLPHCSHSSLIQVAVVKDEDTEACSLDRNITRVSLAKLNSKLTNCTVVYFCSQESGVYLNISLSIQNIRNISFVGRNGFSLDCGGNGGIQITNVTAFEVRNMKFINCSQVQTIRVRYKVDKNFTFPSAITVWNCTDMSFVNVTISNSTGMGLSVINTGGRVTFTDCHFFFNGWGVTRGGAGLFIELSNYHTAGGSLTHSQYSITNCTFVGNRAHEWNIPSTPFGRGAGVSLFIRYNSSHNNVTIIAGKFLNNTASRNGGAFYASLHDRASHNSLSLRDCYFGHNHASHGGASNVGYQCTGFENQCIGNVILFHSCVFEGNTAQHGGASVFTSTHKSNESYNALQHHNCTWLSNSAHYGAAIALLPDTWTLLEVGVLPSPQFQDCTMHSNRVFENNISNIPLRDPYRQNTMGSGAVYCMLYRVLFKGKLEMKHNTGSAILGSSCKLSFDKNSLANFESNAGYYGGALYLIGYSFLKTKNNISLYFVNNTAEIDGGAIYYKSTDMLEHVYSYSCFINITEREDVHFTFAGNLAGVGNEGIGHGNDLFISSLLPCMREYGTNESNVFDMIANFTFSNYDDNDVSTEVSRFSINEKQKPLLEVPVIPGKDTLLPLQSMDDLQNERNVVLVLTVSKSPNSTVRSHYPQSYITNNTIKLLGNPGDEAIVKLSTLSLHKTVLSFQVKLQPCPPGYILITDGGGSKTCVCSADTTKPYIGIESCNLSNFQAQGRAGFWFGYENDQNVSDSSFITGYCPTGFCTIHKRGLLLPSKASKAILSNLTCKPGRKGMLCSECKENYSVYFHSPSFKCGSRDLCHLGWLFYILTDLVPVTIVFAIILIFNISFTSGATNGFIFYAQVIGFFQITAYGRIYTTIGTRIAISIAQSVYRTFNLQFFNHNALSFCLLPKANNLDMIMFQYATFFYSFLLLFLILFTLKMCNIRGIKLLFKCRVHSIQASMIHGLSAFLVLCFAQCANISLSLLSYGRIQGMQQEIVKTVVFLNADYTWFGPNHLVYVIPAMIIAFVTVVIPLMTLLAYPHCYKCLSLLKLQETRCITATCRFLPFDNLKPFLDSFQGCFKDNCRFFSGLYFLYRILILLNMSLNFSNYFYSTLQLILIIMILTHGIFQPYKKRRHNLTDFLLFLNMLFINGISQHNFRLAHVPKGVVTGSQFLACVQVLFIMLPFLVMVVHLCYKALKVMPVKCSRPRSGNSYEPNADLLDYCDLPTSRSEQLSVSVPVNYNTFK